MAMPPNPFIIGKPAPPSHFIGRRAEIATAFDLIFNRSHLAVWGGPGMGKTSFLEQLANPTVWEEQGLDPSEAVIVLLDCESIIPFSGAGFWHEVLTGVKEQLEGSSQLHSEMERLLAQGQASRNSLRQVLAKLGEQGQFLLLLVDDYHAALIPNPKYTEADVETFLSECRSLAHNQERQYLSMIITSSRRLNELGPPLNPYSSPWYNHYFFQPLKPFTDGEIAALLGETLTPELQQGVRQITGGNPYLLRVVSSLLYQQKEQGTEQPNFEALAKEFESRTDSFFQSIWQLYEQKKKKKSLKQKLAGGGRKSILNKEEQIIFAAVCNNKIS